MDETESLRRDLVFGINANATGREALEAKHGQVWDRAQLLAAFDVLAFAAPFVVVRRKQDGKRGTVMFQHQPRFYFAWKEE